MAAAASGGKVFGHFMIFLGKFKDKFYHLNVPEYSMTNYKSG